MPGENVHSAEVLERMDQPMICFLPQKLKANGLINVSSFALLDGKQNYHQLTSANSQNFSKSLFCT